MKPYRILAITIVSLLGLGLLAACSAGGAQNPAAGTLVPTIDLQNQTGGQPAAPGAYPVDTPIPTIEVPAQNAYPADTGPQAVPAVDNRGKITAQLIEQAPVEENANRTRLHVQVLKSEDVAGAQNFTTNLIDKEADIFVETSLLPPGLLPGDTLEAVVSYKGDEQGGIFLAESLNKIAQ